MNQDTVLEKEKEILKKEEAILSEIKKEEKKLLGLERNMIVGTLLVTLVFAGVASGIIFWQANQGRVYIEKAAIVAPQIDLASATGGALEEMFVHPGDEVLPNTVVARVGNDLIKTKVGGVIIAVKNDIGKNFNRGEAIVSMIDKNELRVVGRVEEDKGLRDIAIGQNAVFTVDAFGGKKYYGTVDEISPTSRSSDIVFNISDKRELQEFNINVRFNTDLYQELKNGMSAKIWIYKN